VFLAANANDIVTRTMIALYVPEYHSTVQSQWRHLPDSLFATNTSSSRNTQATPRLSSCCCCRSVELIAQHWLCAPYILQHAASRLD